MRYIAVLPEEKVPRDAEFKFRARAKALVEKWLHKMNADKLNGAGAAINKGGDDKGMETKEKDVQEITEAMVAMVVEANGTKDDMDS